MAETAPSDAESRKQRREFLLKDCDSIYRYIQVLAQMRLAALGASITILGVVVSHSGETELLPRFGIPAILLLLLTITIRMIAVLNRAVFVLFGHLASAEEEMGEMGFASYWQEYVKRDSRDSASHAFTLACRGINVVGTAVAVTMIVPLLLNKTTPIWLIVTSWVALLSLIVAAVLNERVVRKDLDPKGFMVRMRKTSKKPKRRPRLSMS